MMKLSAVAYSGLGVYKTEPDTDLRVNFRLGEQVWIEGWALRPDDRVFLAGLLSSIEYRADFGGLKTVTSPFR